MSKKILLNILTHGDELIGKKVVDTLTEKYPDLIGTAVDIQVANERAYKEKKRYIESDLNRVFPGNSNGSCEERLAYELTPIITAYDLVIDVHSTKSDLKDTIIVTNLDAPTKEILKKLSPRYVLFMNIKPDRALISVAKIGIAFEMGKDESEETFLKTVEGVEIILSHFGHISPRKSFGFETQYFEVFTTVPKPSGARLESHIQNFSLVQKGDIFAREAGGREIRADSDFYPVIFGSTNYETIFGFAARKMKS